jgi:hypothetical protein
MAGKLAVGALRRETGGTGAGGPEPVTGQAGDITGFPFAVTVAQHAELLAGGQP